MALIKPVCGHVAWGWLDARDTVYPRVTLTDLGEVPAYSLDGETGVHRGGVQLDVWALDQAGALSVARALRSLLSGYGGVVLGVKITGVFVTSFTLSSEVAKDHEAKLGRVRMDLALRWCEE